AVTNGRNISAREVTTALDNFEKTPQFTQIAQRSNPNAIARQFEQSYLARLIRRDVLEPRGRQLGITVTSQDVRRALAQLKQRFPTQQAFDNALRQQGLTLAQLKTLVRDRILEGKLRAKVTAGLAPNLRELRKFYRRHLSHYHKTLVSHILVPQQKLAQKIADRLHSVTTAHLQRLFARLARKDSTDKSSATKGGQLGPLTTGAFVSPFQKAAERLKPGEVSEPVHSKFGWHIIYVHQKLQSFAQVRDQIAQRLAGPRQDRAWQRWLIAAYRMADVKVDPRYGVLDVQTQTIIDSRAPFPGAATSSASPVAPNPAPTG
ncbi:MAG: peptidylprolyl isomerase, partial [Actinomycetota bacterium]|nr:peptidylprolyl isomerase [Actinomycetota bacterium]